jgi:hypothetical protein
MKVVRLSSVRTGRLYPPGKIPGTQFCQRLSRPQGHSATGRIMSMKNSNDTIGNRTRDVPACSAVPQPTAPPRSPGNFLERLSKTMRDIRLVAVPWYKPDTSTLKVISITSWTSFLCVPIVEIWYTHPSLFAVSQIRGVSPRIKIGLSGPWVGRSIDSFNRSSSHIALYSRRRRKCFCK